MEAIFVVTKFGFMSCLSFSFVVVKVVGLTKMLMLTIHSLI